MLIGAAFVLLLYIRVQGRLAVAVFRYFCAQTKNRLGAFLSCVLLPVM